ncbi:hypothetical protein CTAM01_04041 [Colletotrichum tamarilloi]|uniref:Secreted protein n=1 Tax=Colletotrichum tamarilloi TaxID=1209934 RepID=A0ABQ9RJ95_9PEZI|nr:uncharacterized protein CTAM01_04041 [Colletotrichum tamarilloi]KAI3546130.1 hypothetical protein CSPX01_04626 [Colletotrichum filicis]KAK1504734.1 hypothetical protein CTAM01_04041 [Colletotrichum tamarilloi]
MYTYAAVPLYPCLCLPYFIVTVYLTSTIPDQLVTAQCDRRRTRGLILDCKRIPESLTSLVLESRRPAFVRFTKVPSWTRRSRSSLQPRSSNLLHFNS